MVFNKAIAKFHIHEFKRKMKEKGELFRIPTIIKSKMILQLNV